MPSKPNVALGQFLEWFQKETGNILFEMYNLLCCQLIKISKFYNKYVSGIYCYYLSLTLYSPITNCIWSQVRQHRVPHWTDSFYHKWEFYVLPPSWQSSNLQSSRAAGMGFFLSEVDTFILSGPALVHLPPQRGSSHDHPLIQNTASHTMGLKKPFLWGGVIYICFCPSKHGPFSL